jgi:hypothetical protein
VSDAWITVAGTLSGTALGSLSGYFLGWTERRDRKRGELVAERKAAYIDLLEGGRKLRYGARRLFKGEAGPTADEIDQWRTLLSVSCYKIEILSPNATGVAANKLRRDVLDYLNAALKTPPGPDGEALRLAARQSGDFFETHVRRELGISDSE